MKIRLEAYAIAREKLGFNQREYDTWSPTVGDLRKELTEHFPAAAVVIRASRIAVNGEYVSDNDLLKEGAEVSLIPPVSGGAQRVHVHDAAIDVQEALAAVISPDAGGVVFFVGTVRDENAGEKIQFIEYESKADMAERELEKLIDQATARFGITAAFIRHRTGRVDVGEASVVIATAAIHRAPAYDANRWLLDRLKEIAPIWKHEARERNGVLARVWLGHGGG